ncbi:MAG: triose-phosphate isomerase [Deltaproteobacteria bacterium]|nr:triose-phosphate isomerase [Deltaproteobacteria bacterium]
MDTRTPMIAGNWKMHKTPQEAGVAAQKVKDLVKGVEGVDVMIAPSFVGIPAVAAAVAGSGIIVAGQNMHWEPQGAYTGEVSAPMLADAGATCVIIGHSERRQYFGETDDTVNKKVRAALAQGLLPVMCVGESEEERDAGKTFEVLDRQVAGGLEGISMTPDKPLVVAYEPVWAIGTGKTATPDQAQEAHAHIREKLASVMGKSLANATRILYGGSVKPGNIAELMAKDDIDGALVGGASLQPESFARIIRFREQ